MKMIIITVTMALFVGCTGRDNRLIYRQSIPHDLSATERLEIERELHSAGWEDVQFSIDIGSDVVTARKARSENEKEVK